MKMFFDPFRFRFENWSSPAIVQNLILAERCTIGIARGGKNSCRKFPDIAFVYLEQSDIVRHPLVGKIIQAYDQYTKNKKEENKAR